MDAPALSALVVAARRGDRGAFDELVRATTADTYALAYRLTGNEDDARDVVQEAYLRAFRGLRRFRGDAQFATWMYRITANCASTLLARRTRNRTELLSDDAAVIDVRPEHDPQQRVSAAEERAWLSAAVAELPWRLRQVIVLRDIYDLPHRSIADELGISEAAAKVRLHRARRRLREVLDGSALDGTGLLGTASDGARLDGARLDGTRLDGARLDGTRLDGTRGDQSSSGGLGSDDTLRVPERSDGGEAHAG
jgi:RNA polymerase sigma-70 factor, ECF subfamily